MLLQPLGEFLSNISSRQLQPRTPIVHGAERIAANGHEVICLRRHSWLVIETT